MNWQDNKFEISVIAGLGLTLFVLFSLFSPIGSRPGFETKDIAYEMARPNSFTPGEYDLSQREIDRQYVNPFEKASAPTNSANSKQSVVTGKKPDAKKGKNNKKIQAQNKKKPGVDVNVVDNTKSTLSDSEKNTTSDANQLVFNEPNKPNQNRNKKENANEDQKNKDQRSPDQWKALLLAEPTYDNMRKLMRAYSDQEIDEASYYKIVQALIENQNPQTQSVGLYGAQGFSTLQSFTIIVKSNDVLSGNAKKFADQILVGYNKPQSVGVLGQALRSNDEAVVMKAAEIISTGIQKYKNGESIAEGNRTSRGDVKIKSASQYSVLVPILQQLANTPNASVSQLAGSLLSQIQSLLASSTTPATTPS